MQVLEDFCFDKEGESDNDSNIGDQILNHTMSQQFFTFKNCHDECQSHKKVIGNQVCLLRKDRLA